MKPQNVLLSADQLLKVESQADELIGYAPGMIDRFLLGEMRPSEEIACYVAIAGLCSERSAINDHEMHRQTMRRVMRVVAVRVLTKEAQEEEAQRRQAQEEDKDEARMLHAEEARQYRWLNRGLDRMLP